jgi:hypothetical protein
MVRLSVPYLIRQTPFVPVSFQNLFACLDSNISAKSRYIEAAAQPGRTVPPLTLIDSPFPAEKQYRLPHPRLTANTPQTLYCRGFSMANHAPIQCEQLSAHFKTCPLHDHERMTKCPGRLRKGGSCTNKAVGPPVPRMMPTCKVHRDQMKLLTWCRAPLPCGFECRRIYEWKPYGFQLCPEHCDSEKICYFLKTPTEIRLRIYQYLLPGRDIPARHAWFHHHEGDGERLFRNILLVNHQIHEEAIGVLYGNRLFNIEFDGHSWRMCNLPPESAQYPYPGIGNHALPDYQMQLMLLEQQNKKRLMMARGVSYNYSSSGQSVHAGSSSSSATGPVEPVWAPPISQRHFNLIQSFRIQIVFAFPGQPRSSDEKPVESKLYEYTDHLHSLIGRLRLLQKPIVCLEVAIKFENIPFLEKKTAFSSAQILLRPFRRLRNVTRPGVSSIEMTDANNLQIELLPTWNLNEVDRNFAEYVEYWFRDLSSDESRIEDPPIFDAYWELKKLLGSINQHCYNQPKLDEFVDLLHAARIVREDDNLPQFREIWDRVVNVWFDYLNYEKEFQSSVALSIDAIYGTISNDSGKGRAWE